MNKALKAFGHIPGPLIFAANDRDFSQGTTDFPYVPRFSNTYGDVRRIPSVLVENHSLKPFKQRVLGTYVFLEGLLQIVSKEATSLKKAIETDNALRSSEVVLTWLPSKPQMVEFLGIESTIEKSTITTSDYVKWTGNPITQKISFTHFTEPGIKAKRPKAYWVPATYKDVIARMAMHGIAMEKITEPKTIQVEM
jgi:hypothetical protein